MAKKHKHEEHENHERWLVSYADFITLLFAFFVVMYAISELDKRKLEKVSHAVRFALATHETGGDSKNPFDVFDAGADRQYGVLERLKIEKDEEEEKSEEGSSEEGPSPPPGKRPENVPQAYLKPGAKDDPALKQAQLRMERLLNIEGLKGKGLGMQVKITDEGLRIRLPGEFLFEPGTTKLKKDAPGLLRDLCQELRVLDREVRVEGHSPRNPFIDAWGMSVQRATRLARFLIDDGGLRSKNVYSAGYGSMRPAPDAPGGQRYEILVLR